MSEDVHVPQPTTEHFQAFLEAADRVALTLLLNDGINPLAEKGCGDWLGNRLNELMPFCYSYKETDVDDHVNCGEVEARIAAAHMVGLALGLRLAGRLGGVR